MDNQNTNQEESNQNSLSPMVIVQIIKAIQPFIKKMVAMEVQNAIANETQSENSMDQNEDISTQNNAMGTPMQGEESSRGQY